MNLVKKDVGGRPPKARNRVVEAMLADPSLIEMSEAACARKIGTSRQTVNAAKHAIYQEMVLSKFAAGMAKGTVVQLDIKRDRDETGTIIGISEHVKLVVNAGGNEGVQTNIHDPTYTVGTNQ